MVQGTRADVERQFDRHEIDEYGLGKLDRLVVEKVFTQPKGKKVNGVFQVTHWAVAEDTLVGMIGVDRHRWRNGLALDGLALEGCFTSTKPLASRRQPVLGCPTIKNGLPTTFFDQHDAPSRLQEAARAAERYRRR
jgi:hypothetical protein